ncbi:sulfur carrier protein ThiS [Fulvivirga sp. RKSG066]|uniref:sulfur carrier protein ThiS n=1 Tax=Fulvivirga aurantia TaxID=2529383 RepID=UPI0012BC14EF|nr:sulfur carrier protein ThiS [Fulvivirga aurantia]MTI22064.1 sulfur carrier protein ThiS [Fulvivirga aurantia]
MQVYLNDTPISITASKLFEVLKSQALETKKGIAVAVNDEVIHRTDWETKQLKENDRILVITATQGG